MATDSNGWDQVVHEPDYRMIAAIVEGPSGPWFIRFLGPAREVSAGESSFDAFSSGLRLE